MCCFFFGVSERTCNQFQVNAGVSDTMRLAALMIDPQCVDLFGRMANPTQDRLAVQFPELRANAIKQQLVQLFTKDFFNNPAFSPQHQADISNWTDDCEYDVRTPAEQRSWIWVGDKLRYIRTGMTTLMANFAKSGWFSFLARYLVMLSQATLKMEWTTTLAIYCFGRVFAIISLYGCGSTYAGTMDGICQLGQPLFFLKTSAWMLVQRIHRNQHNNNCHNLIHLQEMPNGQGLHTRLRCKRSQIRKKKMLLCPCLKFRNNG